MSSPNVNGETIDGALELTRRVGAFQPGEDVRFTVMRDEEELSFTVVLAERPEPNGEETLNRRSRLARCACSA
jgi:S1-C subfamily serine protease